MQLLDKSMIQVPIKDGLGNQMFCIAYASWLKSKGMSVKYSYLEYLCGVHHHGVELARAFPAAGFTVPFYVRFFLWLNILANKFRPFKLLVFKCINYLNRNYPTYVQQNPYEFVELDFPADKDVLVRGSWQNFRYAELVQDELRQLFRFDESAVKNTKILNAIRCTESVSLHIRRGDYLKSSNSALCVIKDADYYAKCMSFVQGRTQKECTFFVFSDDLDWCRKTFDGDNFVFVADNMGDNSYLDMFLMSQCKHNIIANSTFSWWGAWLNANPNKIVCAPSCWTNDGVESSTFCPPSWNFIDANS